MTESTAPRSSHRVWWFADAWRLDDGSSIRDLRLAESAGSGTHTRVRDRETWLAASARTSTSEDQSAIDALFVDGRIIEDALREAAQGARPFHKALSNPMATWRDSQVVCVQFQDIDIDGDSEQPKSVE